MLKRLSTVGTLFGCRNGMSDRAADRSKRGKVARLSFFPGSGAVESAATASSADAGEKPAMVKRVLIVDPATSMLLRLLHSIRSQANVTISSTFEDARRRLLFQAPHLLVTNLRLDAYNGLHLVYLAAVTSSVTRSIVYTDPYDAAFAGEVQAAGAFYERPDALTYVLDAYVRATLPRRDRRSPARVSRRRVLRGGRRAIDLVL
jgi:ActR/RegA family two-component response regulator